MRFPWQRDDLTPLHHAVIFNDVDVVRSLKATPQIHIKERLGYTPVELAKLLGKKECLRIFGINEDFTFQVQFKGYSSLTTLSVAEFETHFHLTYRPYLTFQSYKRLIELTHSLPYLLRLHWISKQNREWGALYQDHLFNGTMAPISLRWIDSQIGYGIYAEQDLPPDTYVGEFTGLVHPLFHSDTEHHSYCLHYPTHLWTSNTFAIDPFSEGNLLRFVNHSDQPNLQPRWIINRNLLHLIFVTNGLVKQGSQLFFNYGEDYWKRRKKFSLNLEAPK